MYRRSLLLLRVLLSLSLSQYYPLRHPSSASTLRRRSSSRRSACNSQQPPLARRVSSPSRTTAVCGIFLRKIARPSCPSSFSVSRVPAAVLPTTPPARVCSPRVYSGRLFHPFRFIPFAVVPAHDPSRTDPLLRPPESVCSSFASGAPVPWKILLSDPSRPPTRSPVAMPVPQGRGAPPRIPDILLLPSGDGL